MEAKEKTTVRSALPRSTPNRKRCADILSICPPLFDCKAFSTLTHVAAAPKFRSGIAGKMKLRKSSKPASQQASQRSEIRDAKEILQYAEHQLSSVHFNQFGSHHFTSRTEAPCAVADCRASR
eukprot:scaffold2908_cov257-Pinguiococcus_pyrenoidosus.AAC.17